MFIVSLLIGLFLNWNLTMIYSVACGSSGGQQTNNKRVTVQMFNAVAMTMCIILSALRVFWWTFWKAISVITQNAMLGN